MRISLWLRSEGYNYVPWSVVLVIKRSVPWCQVTTAVNQTLTYAC